MDNDHSQNVGNVPQDSETFGTIPNRSEDFGNLPNAREKTENHTLTVREVARTFEDAGVARTERSIINWCTLNKQGISRLDCYFDPNERKYFITPQSVDRAIKEEQAKGESVSHPSEPIKSIPKRSEPEKTRETERPPEGSRDEETRNLRAKVRRLTLEGEVGKRYIEKLESEREKFITQMLEQSRQIGSLETKLLQLEAPKDQPVGAEQPRQQHEARDTDFEDLGNDRPWQPQESVRIPVIEDHATAEQPE